MVGPGPRFWTQGSGKGPRGGGQGAASHLQVWRMRTRTAAGLLGPKWIGETLAVFPFDPPIPKGPSLSPHLPLLFLSSSSLPCSQDLKGALEGASEGGGPVLEPRRLSGAQVDRRNVGHIPLPSPNALRVPSCLCCSPHGEWTPPVVGPPLLSPSSLSRVPVPSCLHLSPLPARPHPYILLSSLGIPLILLGVHIYPRPTSSRCPSCEET